MGRQGRQFRQRILLADLQGLLWCHLLPLLPQSNEHLHAQSQASGSLSLLEIQLTAQRDGYPYLFALTSSNAPEQGSAGRLPLCLRNRRQPFQGAYPRILLAQRFAQSEAFLIQSMGRRSIALGQTDLAQKELSFSYATLLAPFLMSGQALFEQSAGRRYIGLSQSDISLQTQGKGHAIHIAQLRRNFQALC